MQCNRFPPNTPPQNAAEKALADGSAPRQACLTLIVLPFAVTPVRRVRIDEVKVEASLRPVEMLEGAVLAVPVSRRCEVLHRDGAAAATRTIKKKTWFVRCTVHSGKIYKHE